jgi:hypothetical protein
MTAIDNTARDEVMYSRACGMGWLVAQRSKALSPPAPCVFDAERLGGCFGRGGVSVRGCFES